jgi:hypothetical protein
VCISSSSLSPLTTTSRLLRSKDNKWLIADDNVIYTDVDPEGYYGEAVIFFYVKRGGATVNSLPTLCSVSSFTPSSYRSRCTLSTD